MILKQKSETKVDLRKQQKTLESIESNGRKINTQRSDHSKLSRKQKAKILEQIFYQLKQITEQPMTREK